MLAPRRINDIIISPIKIRPQQTTTNHNNTTTKHTMKVLINIDQTASLIAGIDAPNSTAIVEIAAAAIPDAIRHVVMPHYDIATGKFSARALDQSVFARIGWGATSIPAVTFPSLLANAGEQEVIAAITAFAEQLAVRDATVDQLAAVKIAADEAKAQKEKADAEAREATRAELRAGLIAGTHRITSRRPECVYIGTIDSAPGAYIDSSPITPDITDIVADYDAAEAAKAQKEKADDEAREAARKVRQIAGKDVHTWDIDQGTIDMSVEQGIPYDSHHRARNWLATVSYGGSKGKLNRSFWGGKGKHAEIPRNLRVGDYIEGGTKDKKGRNSYRYVRVLGITDDTITVREAGTPGDAPPDITKEVEKLAAIREAGLI